MTSNEEIVRKADWAIADLTTNGGLLTPEQSDTFIRKLILQPTILTQVRKVVMTAPERKVNKINFGSRILRKAVEGTALTLSQRAKPVTSQITLNTKEVIAEVRIPYQVIEDNIERGNIGTMQDVGGVPASGGIKDTIMSLIAEQAALDLEELALLGDTASGDDYLALQNGYLKLANLNVVDALTAPISKTIFKQATKAMPDQYMRNRVAMRFWTSVDQEIEYADTLANRETALGDSKIQSMSQLFAYGIPVDSAGLMPQSNILLTHPQNLLFGIQRDIHIETDKDIKSREYIIVLTTRVAVQVEEVEAMIKVINLGP